MPPLPLDPGWLLAQAQQEVSVHWAVVAGGWASVVAIVAAVATAATWGYHRIRRWVRSQAEAVQEQVRDVSRTTASLSRELATSNGHTVGQYVEDSHHRLARITDEINILTTWAGENRDLAREALAEARRAHERLARHEAAGHTN